MGGGTKSCDLETGGGFYFKERYALNVSSIPPFALIELKEFKKQLLMCTLGNLVLRFVMSVVLIPPYLQSEVV